MITNIFMQKKTDKRGQSLTLNTIIIAILAILVLVVVVTFFFGGFKGLTDRIKSTFYSTTAGTDEVLAVQSCQQFCDQAKLLPDTGGLRGSSAYCTTAFVIDGKSKIQSNGKYDIVYTCSEKAQMANDAKIRERYGTDGISSLGIGCPEVECR